MVSEPLELHHKAILYERLRALDTPVSEFSFSNAYLFRNVHRYEVIGGREIFLKGVTYDGYTYLMPTTDIRTMEFQYLRHLMKTVDFLFPIPEPWLPAFDERAFSFSSHRGDTDYLYTVEKMCTYPGRNLHKKRNLLKQFVTTYHHEAGPLLNEQIGDAVSILSAWQEDAGGDPGQTDYDPCLEALDRYEELVLCGAIYYADHEPAGFILGEELNQETFVIHFAKARKRFKGIYQYMYSTFAKVLPSKYRYLNFEQDLDRDALRIAKSSYLPDRMLRKVRVRLK